jgi:hypothetical protein
MRASVTVIVVMALWARGDVDVVAQGSKPVLVSRPALVQAMRNQQSLGYNLMATANGARLSSGVILELATHARATDPSRTPILIAHEDYFEAYLEVLGLTHDKAPTFMRIAADHGEDQLIDYRQERVIGRIVKGAPPQIAVNVVAGWRDGPDVPQQYSYEDRSSSPALRVTHQRVNSYRILGYDDMTVYDDVQGVSGRALGGLLGAMFRIIGDGRAVRSFMAVSSDGIQVTVTTARKGVIRVTQEATVHPDGKGEKGLPPNRPDLKAIEARLRQPFEIEYVPLAPPDPATWR